LPPVTQELWRPLPETVSLSTSGDSAALTIEPSGEGLDCEEPSESPLRLARLLETKVIEMFSIKPETLHEYLRRHFEKISRVQARQFVEQGELPELEVVPKTKSLGSTGR
jgi:hypothetical protein